MFDKHEAPGRSGHDQPHRDAAGEIPLADRPLADREVPLPGASAASSLAMHAWLDGDLPETEARRADARQAEFWSLINAETERRRRMTTPVGVADRIMAALPQPAADARLASAALAASHHTVKGVALTTAVAIGAGLFALGVVVGRLLV